MFVVGSDNTVFAIDAETGEVAWQKAIPEHLDAETSRPTGVSNTQNATPVIDKDAGIIYVSTSDGKLRGLQPCGWRRAHDAQWTSPLLSRATGA